MDNLCLCGCGKKAGVYASTERGHRKGDPRPYAFNHQFRGKEKVAAPPPLNPSGICQCGCGQPAPIAKGTNLGEGICRGQHRRFISGHNGGHNGAHRPFEPLEARYEVRDCGYETPCWVWLRTRSQKGYGRMWSPEKKRVIQASNYFYEHFVEPIPPGLEIDHLCRNPPCVNPAHLEPVTGVVNNRRGVRARIPDPKIEEVKELISLGALSLNEVARRTGLSHPTVTAIARGTYWR